MKDLKAFFNDESGMGTIEIIIIIIVLIGIALLFRDKIGKFVNDLMEKLNPDKIDGPQAP